MNKIRKVLIGAVFLVILFLVTVGTAGMVSGIKYYGYYVTPMPLAGEENDTVWNYSNVVILDYNENWTSGRLQTYIQHRYNQGYNIILRFTVQYFKDNHDKPEVFEQDLIYLKDKLGDHEEFITALYLVDEPVGHGYPATEVEFFINKSKEIFPDIYTFVVFDRLYFSVEDHAITIENENLDIIGIDPYILGSKYVFNKEQDNHDPYACEGQDGEDNKQRFRTFVWPIVYRIKTGNLIQFAYGCWKEGVCEEEDFEEIEDAVHSNSDKKIVMVGQAFIDNGCVPYSLYPHEEPTEYCGVYDLPSICQQDWYYNFSRNDPDIIGHLWFRYSSPVEMERYYDLTEQGILYNYGIGFHVPEMLDQHIEWGLEVLCENQQYRPFCTSDGMSYKNPDQAKCNGKSVTGPGGEGNTTCDSACGASEECHGEVPGSEECDLNCQYIISAESADLNDDGVVDILDLQIVTSDFGLTSDFDPLADTDENGIIDIFDVVFVASRFT